MSETAPPGPGHNLPRLPDLLSGKVIDQMIDVETGPLIRRAAELVASAERFLEKFPTIASDDADAIATTILAACQRFITPKTGRVDAARIAMKAPVLHAQRRIDAAFPEVGKPVAAVIGKVTKLSIAYKEAKNARLQAEQEAEARRLAEDARAAERLAERGRVSYGEAADIAAAADRAAQAATGSVANRTRAYGDKDVGTSSLTLQREITIVDASKVPRPYCSPDMAKLRAAAGKAGDPFPRIFGVEIKDVPKLNVRT